MSATYWLVMIACAAVIVGAILFLWWERVQMRRRSRRPRKYRED